MTARERIVFARGIGAEFCKRSAAKLERIARPRRFLSCEALNERVVAGARPNSNKGTSKNKIADY
jgi:hypothetical protein